MARKNKSMLEEEELGDSCKYCGSDLDDGSGQFCSDDCRITYAEKHVK